MEEGSHIELRSEEVQEILGTPPGWLVRRGIIVITLTFFALLAFSWFYRYPDLIKARIVVLSENPPVTLFAKATGKLEQLLVTDQQVVEEGQLLGIIENPARYKDVYALLEKLDSISPCFEKPEMLATVKIDDYQLGEVHPVYTSFLTQLEEYSTSLRFNLFEEKAMTLQQQVKDLERYLQQLTSQARILNDKLQIGNRQLARDSLLFSQNAISEIDLEKSRSEFLNLEYNYRSSIASIASVNMQISQARRQISEFRTQRAEQDNLLLASTREKYENLFNQLLEWEQDYVLKTPVAGKVTFTNIWNANQQIAMGTAVFSVVPLAGQKIIGRILLPVAGSGKVRFNQKVNIRLDNFPYLEYGILEGNVTNISLVPVSGVDGSYYTAEVSLNQGLVTNYNISLPFSEEMQGEAGIITSERRLITRLVAPLVSLVHERMFTK